MPPKKSSEFGFFVLEADFKDIPPGEYIVAVYSDFLFRDIGKVSWLASVMTAQRSLWAMGERCCNHRVRPSIASGRASSGSRSLPRR
jgi:hypothetical protein